MSGKVPFSKTLLMICQNPEATLEQVKELLDLSVSARVTNEKKQTLLHFVCLNEKEGIAKLLIDSGANASAVDTFKITPLHLACSKKNVSIARLLLDRGANVNAADYQKLTPLHLACLKGNREMAEFLVNRGANVNAVNELKHTPPQSALTHGHPEVAEWLEGVKNIQNQFFSACNRGDFEAVKALFATSSSASLLVNANDSGGRTPLHYACQQGHEKIARLLIDRGANVSAVDISKTTPLHLACFNGHEEVARLLLDSGADVSAANKAKQTPLHDACWKGRRKITELLVNRGANIYKLNSVKKTPSQCASTGGHRKIKEWLEGVETNWDQFFMACCNKSLEVLKTLVAASSDVSLLVNAKDENGQRSLHFACQDPNRMLGESSRLDTAGESDRLAIVNLLIEKGANVNAFSEFDYSPLRLAYDFQLFETVGHLLKQGADVNTGDKLGCTVLHYACSDKNWKMAEFFLLNGANPHIRNISNHTPFNMIPENIPDDTFEKLLNAHKKRVDSILAAKSVYEDSYGPGPDRLNLL